MAAICIIFILKTGLSGSGAYTLNIVPHYYYLWNERFLYSFAPYSTLAKRIYLVGFLIGLYIGTGDMHV